MKYILIITSSIILVGCVDKLRDITGVTERENRMHPTNVDSMDRTYEISVIDVSTGDTIVLQYTNNSARYTEAYIKK